MTQATGGKSVIKRIASQPEIPEVFLKHPGLDPKGKLPRLPLIKVRSFRSEVLGLKQE